MYYIIYHTKTRYIVSITRFTPYVYHIICTNINTIYNIFDQVRSFITYILTMHRSGIKSSVRSARPLETLNTSRSRSANIVKADNRIHKCHTPRDTTRMPRGAAAEHIV